MSDVTLPGLEQDPLPKRGRGAKLTAAEVQPVNAKARRRPRTGAGALVNPDNIVNYTVAVIILSLAALAPLVASVEGLLHVAAWYLTGLMTLTLPFAIDGFMIGAFITSLSLRKRHAYLEAGFVTAFVVILLLFSAVANWLQEYVTADLTTIQGMASPWIKGSMPIITFAAFEAIAMLTSTRRQAENAPLRLAQADVKRLKSELSKAKKAVARPEAVSS